MQETQEFETRAGVQMELPILLRLSPVMPQDITDKHLISTV
jgi:hypothetical protein